MHCWERHKPRIAAAVVGSGAAIPLLERLLIARSALEGGKPGRTTLAFPASATRDRERCARPDQPA
jgi:hypothetical protein